MINTFIYLKLLLKFFFGIEKKESSEYDLASKNFNPVKLVILITVSLIVVYSIMLTYKLSILTTYIQTQCPNIQQQK